VEVHGWPEASAPLSVHDIEAWELHTAVIETGSFSSSAPLLNTIQSNCQWTARSNLMSIPTDCPQRDERRGWMGDAAIGASVNVYNSEMHAFYANFLDLISDDAGTARDGDGEGALPNWVPVYPSSDPNRSSFPGAGAPNWMTAYPSVLYEVWQMTGDTELVLKHWPKLLAYMAWYVFFLELCTRDGRRS
jgi:alpha-L-rhamnosidase